MDSLEINTAGIATDAEFIESPNQDDRPDDTEISMVVIHNISLPPREYGGSSIVRLFTNQLDPGEHPYYEEIYQLKVSSHFLIRRDGQLLQFVPCSQRAWHAGTSNWNGRERCNDFSVGIELEGSDFDAFADAQYETLNHLLDAIKRRYPIRDVVGHSDIAPGRKTDPGPYFDWQRIDGLHRFAT
jgi:AmpD protein